MKKSSILLLLPAMMLLGCNRNNNSDYIDKLPDEIEQGIILHAFGWSFNQIKENLPAIRDAGYKAVQTMPVQQPKSGGADWTFFYQPVSFSVATSSPVGDKDDLTALCTEADKYGIDIIADIVFNHMATDGSKDSDGLPTVDSEVKTYEPYIYQNQDVCFHHSTSDELSGSASITQVYSYGSLPDLNTANEYVQGRALSLLKECIDCGVDGFRFDAAKHIETPDDPQAASDFWVNTLEEAKTYYKSKNDGKELFAYGEILNDVDGGRDISCYTQYMNVTDNGYVGSGVSNAVLLSAHDASLAVNASYGKNTDATNLVTWAESHDTYTEETSHTSMKKMMREWAIIASRKDTTCLFFARPNEDASKVSIPDVGTTYYEDENIGVINRFHNRFIGAEEYQNAQETNFYINERYSDDDAGAIIVDLALKGNATISFTHLKDGTYYDQITANKVVIKNGKANISFASIGYAVLTKTNNKLRPTLSIDYKSQKYVDPFDVTVTIENGTSMSYQIDGGEKVSFVDTVTITIGSDAEVGDITTLTINYSNGEYATSRTYSYEKIYIIDGVFNVINLNESYLTDYELYIWSWTTSSKYSQDYTWNAEHKILIIDDASNYTGFLLVIFEKDHVPSSPSTWESPIKQTSDIDPDDKFFDASNF